MANVKISELPPGSSLTGDELFESVQTGQSVQLTADQIKTFTSSSPSLVTPSLGTPSSGTLTNCSGLPGTGVNFTGITAATLPLTGAETFMLNDGVSNKVTYVDEIFSAVAYGELYVASGTTPQTTSGTANTWTKLTCFTTIGLNYLVSPSAANDSITFGKGAIYQVNFFNTFTDSANTTYSWRLYNETSGAAYPNTTVSCTTSSTDPSFVASSAIVAVAYGDVISVQVSSTGVSKTFTVQDANISVVQVAQV